MVVQASESIPDLREMVDFSKVEVSERPTETFVKQLPDVAQDYIEALEDDRASDDEGIRFKWGEINPGLSARQMFETAMRYTIEAEALSRKENPTSWDETDLRDTRTRLQRNFGPKGTKSNRGLERMGEVVKKAFDSGLNERALKHHLYETLP